MATEKIDIVMFGMSCYTEWQAGIANRNFHVLHTLLQDERVRKVVYVEYLPFTWKRALRQWLQNVVGGVGGKVVSQSLTHRFVAVREAELERTGYRLPGVEQGSVPYKLFVYSDVSSVWSEALVYRRLHRELERLDCKNLVLWSYLPTFVGYFGQFSERTSVFDAVDNWLEHSSYQKVRDRLKLNYETIRQRANFIFTTSSDLVTFFDRPHCTFVPNGVSLEHVAQAPKVVGTDIASLPRPIIGYVGTPQKDRIDTQLLSYLAQQNPTKSIAIVGATGLTWPSLSHKAGATIPPLPNIHFLGRKPFREALAYMREFNVAIIPHLQNEFNRHTNPLKLYEYLSLGKPVVTTSLLGLEEFSSFVHVGPTPAQFNHEVLTALGETSQADVVKRQEFVKAHTWTIRVDTMLKQVFEKLTSPAVY